MLTSPYDIPKSQELAIHRFRKLVHLRPVYMVIGRLNKNWQTVLEKTTSINTARHALYAASESGRYGHVILCEALAVPGDIRLSWQSVECALPVRARVVPTSQNLSEMLAQIKHVSANKNHIKDVSVVRKRIPKFPERKNERAKRSMSQPAIVSLLMTVALVPNAVSVLVAGIMVLLEFAYIQYKMDCVLSRKWVDEYKLFRTYISVMVSFILVFSGIMAFVAY